MKGLLIVEDEYITRNHLVNFYDWERLGIDWVEQAENGEQALKIIKNHTPDVIITDIKMPYMTGIELAEKLQQCEKTVSVIVISAYVDISYFKQAIKLKVFDYILKPIDPKEILASVCHALEYNNIQKEYKTAYKYIKAVQEIDSLQSDPNPVQMAVINEEPMLVRRIKELIEKEYMLPDFSISSIAKRLNFTSSYLCMIFKKNTSQTINDYITSVRINNAKMLLSDLSLKLYEVAELVGFSDENYFSKVFKKVTGISPASYRKGESPRGKFIS